MGRGGARPVLGVDVILDFGFWSQSERQDFRLRAAQLGASSEVHYLAVPEAELLARLTARNAQLTEHTFLIPEVKLKEWLTIFQPPTADELVRMEAS